MTKKELETKQKRIEIIKNKAKRNADAEETAKRAKERERNKLKTRIEKFSEQIKTIIELANVCQENNVEIPSNACGYPVIANGISHHTGLIKSKRDGNYNIYDMIGIKNGGYCGVYDFWTDGDDMWSVHEDTKEKKEPSISDMEKFIEEFPAFSKSFLRWVDTLEE